MCVLQFLPRVTGVLCSQAVCAVVPAPCDRCALFSGGSSLCARLSDALESDP